MNLRRVGILLGKEFVRGPRNFVFIMAVVVPLALTLLLALLFGTIFSGKARLGVVDQGDSQLVPLAMARDSLSVRSMRPRRRCATRSPAALSTLA